MKYDFFHKEHLNGHLRTKSMKRKTLAKAFFSIQDSHRLDTTFYVAYYLRSEMIQLAGDEICKYLHESRSI